MQISENHQLLAILDRMVEKAYPDEILWQGWQVSRITGGMNNLVYRATQSAVEYAIKWTVRDERDRAGREYAALTALQQAGLAIAPRPVLVERERYPRLVVVQTWLNGAVSAEPPVTDSEWFMLLDHLRAVHSVTPPTCPLHLQNAVLTMTSAADGKSRVRQQKVRIPEDAHPPMLRDIWTKVERLAFPTWSDPSLTLSKTDPNCRNYIRNPHAWASVDWENSGWGDPAFDIADMMAHPAYMSVSRTRWHWVIDQYCSANPDPSLALRIRTYYLLTLVWWVAWFAREAYQLKQGNTPERLALRPASWPLEVEAKFAYYIERAQQALSDGVKHCL